MSTMPYINTGYVHKANTRIVMECDIDGSRTNNYQAPFGSRAGYDNKMYVFFWRFNGNNKGCFARNAEVEGTGGANVPTGEKIKVEKPTIEHLLPQTPSDKWKDELGGKKKLAEAMEYVDTLGNLSLANHDKNSELGNKSRKEKAEILKKYGEALSVLNKDFIELDKFSLDFIKQRAKKLIKIIKDRFYIDETIKTDRIYFDDYDIFMGRTEWCDELKGRVPTYVEIEGNSYQTPSFYHVGLEMFAYFGRNYKEKLTELATHSPTWSHRR